MARVLYSAEINELKGSVGGTTFQRNKSGTIAKLKSSLVFYPTSKQVLSHQAFNLLVGLWSNLSYANKVLWQTFALNHTKYNYFGVEKNLSAFNWFISINSNRMLTEQSYHNTPPTYITPITAPSFEVFPLSNTLSILFDVFAERDNYYLFVFASPPLRSINLQSRRTLRLIKIIDPDNCLYYDLTSDWEDYFNISYPSASNSEDFNILVAVSCVHKNSGIAGSFYLDNKPLDLDPDPTAVGDSISSSGTLFSETWIYSLIYIGSGIVLAGTFGAGKILRSSDYASSFSDLGTQFSQTTIYCFAYCGNGIVLAGTGNGGLILKSTNYGANWSNIGQLGAETDVYTISYCGNGVCIAGTFPSGKIYRSTDYGANWSDLGTQYSQSQILSSVYCGNGIVLAGTGSGGLIIRSTNNGANWSNIGQLGSETTILSLAYCGDGICIAGTQAGGKIFRSTDNGANWSDLGDLGLENRIYSLKYMGHGVVFAGTYPNAKIYRSTDYGVNWTDLGSQFSQTFLASLASFSLTTVLAGTATSALVLTGTE